MTSEKVMRPPKKPWTALPPDEHSEHGGCVSVFLSDSLSPLPVRGVTLPGNNKSDPNIETMTYGLFSTCSRPMRASIVKRKLPYIFFLTNRGSGRLLVGYYRVGWYAPGPLPGKPRDFAIAASACHFVAKPIPVGKLPKREREVVGTRFRLSKLISKPVAAKLVEILHRQNDATQDYLDEVSRLERFNEYRTEFRYVDWRRREPFTWTDAKRYLQPAGAAVSASNSSPTDRWGCTACGEETQNKALLKCCPWCGAVATLKAIN